MRADERATAVYEATRSMELVREDGNGNRIELQRAPDLFYGKDGELVGVDAWVKMFRGADEVRVDPHRIFINPPTQIVLSRARGLDLETGKRLDREVSTDPEQALWDVLSDSVRTVPNPRGWRTRGTVTTAFSGTSDGYINSSSSVSYSAARAGSGTLSADTTDTFMRVGQDATVFKGTIYDCWESFVSFDTSSITDTDVVSSVLLEMVGDAPDASSTDFTVNAREFNWGASLTTADWVAGASLDGNTLLATLSTVGFSTAGYNTFSSEAAFLTATNLKTGTVFIIVSSSRHEGNNTPTGDEYVDFDTADNAGTTTDPKLTITHAPAGSSAFYTSRPNRIWRRR